MRVPSQQIVRLKTSEKLSSDGKALARLPDGKIVFVKGALPLEDVEAELIAEKKDYAQAVMTAVIDNPSVWRTAPRCPQFLAGCGGCQLWHLTDAGQKELKKQWLLEALERVGKWPLEIRQQVAAQLEYTSSALLPTQFYRQRIRLHVSHGRVGFFKNQSHQVVDANGCLITSQRIPLYQIIAGLKTISEAFECEITVSAIDKVYIRVLSEHKTLQTKIDRVFRSELWWTADPLIEIPHPLHDKFMIHADGFVQPHERAQERYVNFCQQTIAEFFKNNRFSNSSLQAWDLYAGSGVFSAIPGIVNQQLANPYDLSTMAVEGINAATKQIAKNWAHLPFKIESRAQDVGEFLKQPQTPVQIVITDPSREGMGRETTEALVKHIDKNNPALVIYVACDAASLARDGAVLIQHGFCPIKTLLADAFGQTVHFETLMAFYRYTPSINV